MSSQQTDQSQHLPVSPKKRVFAKRSQIRWETLSPTEKQVVTQCMTQAGLRAALGAGMGLTVVSAIAAYRRSRPPLPTLVRLFGSSLLLFGGAYVGGASALPTCIRSIAAIPDSELGELVAVSVGEWDMDKMKEAYLQQLQSEQDRRKQDALNEEAKRVMIESGAKAYVQPKDAPPRPFGPAKKTDENSEQRNDEP